jgi:hypothetical protein
MCVVPTLTFERLFAGHGRRQLLWFEVTRHPTAAWLARQITDAFPGPRRPPTARQRLCLWTRLHVSGEAMGIGNRPISFGRRGRMVLASTGTLRCECLDHMLIFSQMHLRRIFSACAEYYNQARTHLANRKLHRCNALKQCALNCQCIDTSNRTTATNVANPTNIWASYGVGSMLAYWLP